MSTALSREIQIGIIGGGASGVLAAIHLLRTKFAPTIHIFNDRGELGRGVAYSPPSGKLVLNVRAGNMSAYLDQPGHFVDWLRVQHPGIFTGDCFVPRHLYGDYLRDTLAVAESSAEGKLHAHPHQADRLQPSDGGYLIHDASGNETFVNRVILALGNAPPANPHLDDERFIDDPRYLANAWHDGDRLRKIRCNETIVLLGAGLTAVDSVLQLRQQGHRGKIEIISRRGKWPELHIEGMKANAVSPPTLVGLSPAQALHRLRAAVSDWQRQGGNWRHVIDSLRPETNKIWASWTTEQRRRFLRHARPYWDSHRHRTCSGVWLKLHEQIEAGTLTIRAGRILGITPQKDHLEVRFKPRGTPAALTTNAGYVLNCTGSENLSRTHCQPLLKSLLTQNLVQLDPLGLGLLTDPTGHGIAPDGHPIPNIIALGPTRRGTLWETTAVPEIRAQASLLVGSINSGKSTGPKKITVSPLKSN